MLSIGDLSRRTGVKVPTIRYYEQMGLIAPPARTNGNQRRYSDAGLQQLSFIRHSRDLGFTIEDIRELLDLNSHPDRECADAHNIASRHLAETREKIKRLKRLERELKRISACDAGSVAHCDVLATLADHGLCQSEH